jgi:RNA polymerase sigma-70 factor, ECF subfamily
MCDNEDRYGVLLSFEQFVGLLQQPPHEPCESELRFYTRAQYDEAFKEAHRLYYRKIKYHIARITRDYDGAEDLTQDVFLDLYNSGVSFDAPYIYRAARNTAYDELRRQGRERRYPDYIQKPEREVEIRDTRPLQDVELYLRDRERAVNRAVELLDEKFRIPLMLRVEGNSYAQIMEMTQAKEGTVKSRICRGKRILKRKLRAYLADGVYWK